MYLQNEFTNHVYIGASCNHFVYTAGTFGSVKIQPATARYKSIYKMSLQIIYI